jgi:hypothetical protein
MPKIPQRKAKGRESTPIENQVLIGVHLREFAAELCFQRLLEQSEPVSN